jgi:hypothetical protein
MLAAGTAGFFVTLLIVLSASRLRQPAVQSVDAGEMATTPSSDADAASIVETTPAPTWVGRRQAVWASDGTRSLTFKLDPVTDTPILTSRGRPQLVARCLSRITEVYVVTGPLSFEGQGGSHTVRVQVDDGPEESQQWLDSESSQELFAPDGSALSDEIAQAHRLRISFTPFNAKPVTMEFMVDGFDQLAPLLARTCGRRPSRPTR